MAGNNKNTILKSIDDHLKSCSPYNVYTFSFTAEEVEYINKALAQKSLVDEIKQLVKEEDDGRGKVIRG